MESFKKALLPFVPPPLRGLKFQSFFILFDAILKVLKFGFTQLFFVHRLKFLSFLLWFTCWLIAIHVFDFGAIYFMVSTLIFMFYNLGTRKDGTLSAYSVFNPRGIRLLGQLDASNFENEIRHRNTTFNDVEDENETYNVNDDDLNDNNNNNSVATKRIKRGNSKKARRAEAKRKKKMNQVNDQLGSGIRED